MASDVLEGLKSAVLDLDKDRTLQAVQSIINCDGSITAKQGVDAVAEALQVVGRRFQEGEWFVGELVYAGEVAKAAIDLLTPLLAADAQHRLGTVVVGTVAGDLHDLGKNIFITYAQAAGFALVDLGVDVAAQKFVGAVQEHHPVALGMSCLLTITAGEVRKTVEALRTHGVRDQVKVIVGGAALTEQFARESGVDAFAPDAVTGTNIIRAWSGA